EISSTAVTSIISYFRPDAPRCSRASLIPATMNGGIGSINRCKRACAMHRRSGRFRPLEHQSEIVGGHLGDFDKRQTGTRCQLLQGLDIADAPFGVAFAKTRVERGIAERG